MTAVKLIGSWSVSIRAPHSLVKAKSTIHEVTRNRHEEGAYFGTLGVISWIVGCHRNKNGPLPDFQFLFRVFVTLW